MSKFTFINNLDVNKLFFAPVQVDKSKKKVPVYMSDTDLSWRNRVTFQMCKNETEHLVSKYGMSAPKEDATDTTRRNMAVTVSDKDTINKFKELDEKIIQIAIERAKEWWKKDLAPEAVRFKYHPTVKYDEKLGCDMFRFKVALPSPDRKSFTEIFTTTSDDNEIVVSNHEVLGWGVEVNPVVSSAQIWFLGENQFGISFTADILVAKPASQMTNLERMQGTYKVKEEPSKKQKTGTAESSSTPLDGKEEDGVKEEDDGPM